jgi:hypothetical protein
MFTVSLNQLRHTQQIQSVGTTVRFVADSARHFFLWQSSEYTWMSVSGISRAALP